MINSIAIDGPAGAGKSTIAKIVAKELGFIYVDTGAMYRALALFLIRNDISGDNVEGIESVCQAADISIDFENGEQIVTLNGENVNGLIRTEEVGNMASVSSANGKVREKLVALQQKLAGTKSVVMDGRDIGTVVIPDAILKIYLTASSEVRAKRRLNELEMKGIACDYNEVLKDIEDRDYRDMHRENSPLKRADDAVLVDSSYMGVNEVADTIIKLYRNKI